MVDKNGKKATKYEKRQRVLQVIEMLSKGWSEVRIVRHIASEDGWGIGERMARNYVKAADDEIYETIRATQRDRLLARCIHRLEGAADLSMEMKQPAAAVGAISAISKLTGIGAVAS